MGNVTFQHVEEEGCIIEFVVVTSLWKSNFLCLGFSQEKRFKFNVDNN